VTRLFAFLPALLVSATVVLSAPFMGQARAWLRTTFPDHFLGMVGGAVFAALGAGIVIALVRIRYGRWLRYGAVAAAFLLGFAYNAAQTTGNPETDVVERVHFVQYGLIALLFYRAWRPRGDASIFALPVFAGVIVGTIEEWFQWFIPVRVGEVRDVALNLVAVTCGLLFSAGVAPPQSFSRYLQPGSSVRLGLFASAALIGLAAFVHAVHLGFVVSLEGVGTFKSRYQEQTLRALSADRAARWRRDPPTTFTRLSREDQYLDEGFWHVRRRNEAWAATDYATARNENRILEAFFAPVLDTPSYAAKTGNRWHADQREQAEREGGIPGARYVSRAEPLPILDWSKGVFWLVAIVVAAALTGLGWLGERRGFSVSGRADAAQP
jgi:VanZ family protein